MKTTKNLLCFCNQFTFLDHYNIDRIIELNYVRDCKLKVLSKCDLIDEILQVRVLDVIDDISLKVIDGNIGYLVHELNKLRVGFSKLLCLEKFYEDNTNQRDEKRYHRR